MSINRPPTSIGDLLIGNKHFIIPILLLFIYQNIFTNPEFIEKIHKNMLSVDNMYRFYLQTVGKTLRKATEISDLEKEDLEDIVTCIGVPKISF